MSEIHFSIDDTSDHVFDKLREHLTLSQKQDDHLCRAIKAYHRQMMLFLTRQYPEEVQIVSDLRKQNYFDARELGIPTTGGNPYCATQLRPTLPAILQSATDLASTDYGLVDDMSFNGYDQEYKDFVNKYRIYAFVPPFDTTVIRVNKHRYFMVQYVDILPEEAGETLHDKPVTAVRYYVLDFTNHLTYGFHINAAFDVTQWIPAHGVFDDLAYTPSVVIGRDRLYSEAIYRDLIAEQPDVMTQEEFDYMQGAVKAIFKNEDERKPGDYYISASNLAGTFISGINMLLMKNRPEKGYPKPRQSRVKTAQTLGTSVPQKETTIGNLIIRHRDKIHVYAEPSERKYILASWDRRGFVRHNRNGTISHVRPTTVRRKELNLSIPGLDIQHKTQKTKFNATATDPKHASDLHDTNIRSAEYRFSINGNHYYETVDTTGDKRIQTLT